MAAADVSDNDIDLSFSDTSGPFEAAVAHPVNSDINGLLLSELKHLSSKMDSMEKRLATTEQKLKSPSKSKD